MRSQAELSTAASTKPAATNDKRYGYLFGSPIRHSLAPRLHQTIFDKLGLPWEFSLLESTDMEHFLQLIRSPELYGSAVTMPHKLAIIPHLDELTEEGRAVGAVNTIFRRGDKIIGTNTDTIGVRESFYQNVANPDEVFHGRPGMVIGGGGAARSAVYALVKFMQCPTVYLVNRDPGEVEAVVAWCKSQGYGDHLLHVTNVHQAEELAGPGAVVSCVPNFPPVTEAEKMARAVVEVLLNKPARGAMLEMCYHPTPRTELRAIAEHAGWQVILGTEAMIYQGLEQHTYWHGHTIEASHVKEVKEIIAGELSNVHS